MNKPTATVAMPTLRQSIRWTEIFARFCPYTDVQHRPEHVLSFLVRESLDIGHADLLRWARDLDSFFPEA